MTLPAGGAQVSLNAVIIDARISRGGEYQIMEEVQKLEHLSFLLTSSDCKHKIIESILARVISIFNINFMDDKTIFYLSIRQWNYH